MNEHNDISQIIETPLHLEIYPGSRVLRQTALPVEIFGDALLHLADRMLDFMRRHDGIGLAAPQIRLSRRIIVIELDGRIHCVINPDIVHASSDCDFMNEGCLSLPGKIVSVKRHRSVRIQGQDATGKPITVLAEALLAKAFQHEIDHLDGILICDYET